MFQSAVRTLALLAAAPLLTLCTPTAAHADYIVPAPITWVVPWPAVEVLPVPVATLMSQVVTMTNQQRNAYGCGQLAVDQDLIIAAERQSWYMAATNTLSHFGWGGSTFIERARVAGYLQPAGENIAWGYATAQEVMAAWMASPEHRANLLDCGMRSIGTGVTYSAEGTPYYAQVFGWR